jgi:hypothetical protein
MSAGHVLLLLATVLVGLAVVAAVVWWPWGLAVAGGVALAGGFFVWVLVVMPRRLAPPVPDNVTLNDARTRLRNDLRSGPLQLLTALLTVLAVLVGAWLGFQQLTEDRDQARQDRQLTRQGQASERFTRAIDQLSSRRVETRIGGIYGLDQIAEQSPENTGPVAEVLLAWLNGRPRPPTQPYAPLRERAPDVQAALSVLTRQRYFSIVAFRLDLQGLDLKGADLPNANLFGALLRDADLTRSRLDGADLRDAHLSHADLDGASLRDVDLRGTKLHGAHLHHADLSGADLRDVDLDVTKIFGTSADTSGPDLRGTILSGADLRGADLYGVDLSSAKLRGAKVDERTRWPRGFDWRRSGAALAP